DRLSVSLHGLVVWRARARALGFSALSRRLPAMPRRGGAMKAALKVAIPLMLALGCGAPDGAPHGEGGDAGTTVAPMAGPACLPEAIPAGGYSAAEVYLETNSASCASRACLVYQLDG